MSIDKTLDAVVVLPIQLSPYMHRNCRLATRLITTVLSLALCAHSQMQSLEQGLASWYGPTFGGQVSANGEAFDPEQLTAAHRTLPFGTKVRVHRLDAEMSVVVRITDRGPYIGSRIIDLSFAAARQLGVNAPGLIPVALEVVEKPDPVAGARAVFAVQAGTFRNFENARRTGDRIRTMLGSGVTVDVLQTGSFWRVLAGASGSEDAAATLAIAIRKSDPALRSAFVIRIDAR